MNFDSKKPFNLLPFLPPKIDLDDVQILKKVNLANIALSKLEGSSLSIPNRKLLIEPLSVREAVASSGIENINTTVAEIFQAELFPGKEISKAQKETLHYKDALVAGLSFIQKLGFLHTNSFLEIQKILEPNKAGIRKLPGTSIKNSITGEIIYTPPEGEAVLRQLLQNYENYYNDFDDDVDSLIKLAILHYQFEAIHPFYDGNGRTGRILMVLHLVLAKRIELPILFISGFINEHRSDYYRLLNRVTKEAAWRDWILFILNAIEVQATETAQTVTAIKQMHKEYKNTIKNKLPKIYSADLVDYLLTNPFYSQQSLSRAIDKERKTAAKYLNALLEIELIEVFKLGREKIYFCPKLLKLLS
jgi:Fic family protein